MDPKENLPDEKSQNGKETTTESKRAKFLSYAGRIGRLKYFLLSALFLFLFIFLYIINIGATWAIDLRGNVGDMFFLIRAFIALSIILILQSLAIVKRFHDLDRPSHHYWLLIIPGYNIYLWLILLFQKGTEGQNHYGTDPLTS